jgi:anaerobic magnesium-protoporphyrin IX monomethyl ester cyclase
MAYTPSDIQRVFNITSFESDELYTDNASHKNRKHLELFPATNPKILLLEPYFPPEAVWGSLKTEQGYLTPLGTISIYRWLTEKGYDVEILDTQFGDHDEEGLKGFLKDGQFNMIGLPVFTPTASYVFDTAKLVKEALPNCVIVYGGVHVTDMAVESMEESPECDFVIRREGEYTIVELIEMLKAGKTDFEEIEGLTWRKDFKTIVENPDRKLIPDLDDTPLGIFGDLDLTRYVPHPTQYINLPNHSIFTQRGCPYPCTFCEASTALGKQLRVFSPPRVIEELKILKYEKGARGIYFQDSTFTLNRKYVVDLFERMIKEGLNDLAWSCNTRTDRVDPELLSLMYEAGCRTIAYGIESANQQSLDVLKKNIKVEVQEKAVNWTHKAKISMLCNYILCVPGETEEMVQNTINYAKRLGSQMALFYLPVPYPGSELYKICKEQGGLRDTKLWSEYLSIDFDNPVYINPKIGKEQMKHLYKKAYREYYTTPKVWLNSIKSLMWNGGIHRYLRGINAVRSLIFHKES